MISINDLTQEELLALKGQATTDLEDLNREQINLQFRLDSNFARQLSSKERVTSATTEVDTFTAILATLQGGGAPQSQLDEYQNKLDVATLRLKIAQASFAKYSNVSLVQLQKEVSQLAEKETSFQDWITEIDQLINS